MNTRPLADISSPWNHLARRFIDAPIYRFCAPRPPHPLANFWRLELMQDGVRHTVENDKPILDAAPIWPKIRVGSWMQCSVYQFDHATNWCVEVVPMGARIQGTSIGLIAKAPDWVDRDEAPLDYAASIRANLGWFDSHEKNPNAFYREPGMPAWWWHAAEGSYPQKLPYQEGSYPALASLAIRAYLFAARAVPDRVEHCRKIACAVGNWLLKNRTPMTGAAPGMPWTTMREGKFEYSVDGNAINLSRGALPGFGMLMLFQDTGEKKYLEYAQHIAGVLTRFIDADGSMPYRIRPETGEVVEEYTCGHVLVALFLDALDPIAPDERWSNDVRRILHWICEHPMRDFNWKGCFEDVGEKTPFANLASLDATWVVRLLARHAKGEPQLLDHAHKLLRWVEDQFVNFGDEASLNIRTYYPAVREQWICDYPMEGHGANYAESCWDLYQATGDATYRRKAVATLNAIVRSQRADGAYSTWARDRETGLGALGSGYNWFNANHAAMSALGCFLLRQKGGTPLPH